MVRVYSLLHFNKGKEWIQTHTVLSSEAER